MSNQRFDQLKSAIETKTAVVAVIGLGYVGLPVACMFAKAGFETLGIDVVAERITKINAGENPIEGKEPGLAELLAEVTQTGRLRGMTTYDEIHRADVITISVQTPIEEKDHLPRYKHLTSALESLGKVLKDGALVIIESTLAPGTMHRVVIPTLESASGKKVGVGFTVGHCPERVMPGRLLHNITQMSRVVGGYNDETSEVMTLLYRNIVQGELDKTDILMAELVKTTENAYRDVQIAFANEIAQVCELIGGDVWTLRELVNKSPGRFMLYPGAGVGGHCIPKDPWLLIANVRDQFNPQIIPSARYVNRYMPSHVGKMTENALKECGIDIEGATVAVLGYAYLANSDDTRDTPSEAYVEILKQLGAVVRIHDPYVHEYNTDLAGVLAGADAAVMMVAHDEYFGLDWAAQVKTMKTPVIIDTRHILPDDFTLDGAVVKVLGRGTIPNMS